MSELFFEVFEHLPRQGPGSRACTARALELCRELPPSPSILDLGCGGGAQTIHLAELSDGKIVAVDAHAPLIERLRGTLAASGLSDRVEPVVGDMERLELDPGSFDLIWSEGAFYNLGIEKALEVCSRFLCPGGYVAFTDAVWRTESPPAEVAAAFAEYPGMGRATDLLATVERGGFSTTGHFPLPDEAWWEEFYTPMGATRRDATAEVRCRCRGSRDARRDRGRGGDAPAPRLPLRLPLHRRAAHLSGSKVVRSLLARAGGR